MMIMTPMVVMMMMMMMMMIVVVVIRARDVIMLSMRVRMLVIAAPEVISITGPSLAVQQMCGSLVNTTFNWFVLHFIWDK